MRESRAQRARALSAWVVVLASGLIVGGGCASNPTSSSGGSATAQSAAPTEGAVSAGATASSTTATSPATSSPTPAASSGAGRNAVTPSQPSLQAGAVASAGSQSNTPAAAGSGGPAPAASQPSPGAGATANALERPFDPVVLTGELLAPIVGKQPDALVAFRFAGDAWKQIPLQVDERAKVDYYAIYNKMYSSQGAFVNLVYVDPGTLTGADSDAMIDADDELVFMARDAGAKPEVLAEPPGVKPGSAVIVHIADPKDAKQEGYVYLFEHDGTLKPDAGTSYGKYDFKLKAGSYPANYKFRAGPNPEDSTFKSRVYERHFADRWLSDVIKVTVDGASGVDILDVQETRLLDGCTRNVKTFDQGEGAFATNKAGAVRTIRSYIGANSGPLTQRTHWFYEAREDQLTELRVHALPNGPADTIDFGPEGAGLTYYDNLNAEGALIDGTMDKVKAASNDDKLTWNMVTGPQGTVLSVFAFEVDINGLTWSSIYVDEKNTRAPQCEGDTQNAYGESGPSANGLVPTTDPTLGATNKFNSRRVLYYLGPNAQVTEAKRLEESYRSPLVLTVTKP